VVPGQSLKERFFGGASPLGQRSSTGSAPFQVLGVMAPHSAGDDT
jgi:hypothetical protein